MPLKEQRWFTGGVADLPLISFVAPTTSEKRQREIVAAAEGFLYCISTTGVTGPRGELPSELEQFLLELKAFCPLPQVVGFGIADLGQVKRMAKIADGIIVGSALVDILQREGIEGAVEFVQKLKQALLEC